jgi:hypothetical protein
MSGRSLFFGGEGYFNTKEDIKLSSFFGGETGEYGI